MATTKQTNRPANLGGGNVGGASRVLVDDGSGGDSQWLFYGMLFFAIVCFICLPIMAVILIEAKKTNVAAHAALMEVKKLRAEIKAAKKDNDE